MTKNINQENIINTHFDEHLLVVKNSKQQINNQISRAANLIANAIRNNKKLLCCGNGGSSGDASHLASEFINRFELERSALPAIALTTDSAVVTSIANDYNFTSIFSRQIEALGFENDCLIAFSTSGNSKNVIAAINTAHKKGMAIIAITGKDGGEMQTILNTNDIEIRVPSDKTSRIQEIHLIVIHTLCDLVDKQLFNNR